MGLLDEAGALLTRLTPQQAHARQRAGALIIDVRTDAHRAAAQNIPGALVIDLTVLPWRLDPTFAHRIPEATGWERPYVLVCRHGYSSAVHAALLRRMGLTDVTDIEGGYEAWVAAGLPTTAEPADIRP